jgi:hypothetical protein
MKLVNSVTNVTQCRLRSLYYQGDNSAIALLSGTRLVCWLVMEQEICISHFKSHIFGQPHDYFPKLRTEFEFLLSGV